MSANLKKRVSKVTCATTYAYLQLLTYFLFRPYMKWLSRQVENNVRSAEILFTMAWNNAEQKSDKIFGYLFEHIYSGLVTARRNLALFQHHDAITGEIVVAFIDVSCVNSKAAGVNIATPTSLAVTENSSWGFCYYFFVHISYAVVVEYIATSSCCDVASVVVFASIVSGVGVDNILLTAYL